MPEQQQKNPRSWRKRLMVAALMIVGLHGFAFALGNTSLNAQADTPKYEIVQTKDNVGVAKNTDYYVLIDPVDLSSEAFKDTVKSILTDIAKKEGKPEFGATIYTDKEVLEYDTGIKGMPEDKDYFSGSTEDRFRESLTALNNDIPDSYLNSQQLAYRKAVNAFKAKQKEVFDKKDVHLVASYTGGFNYDTGEASKDDGAYNILWFGSTDNKHPQVGKYAGDEKWKPAVEKSDEKKDSDCFIATAAYGTHLTHDLDVLRDFRDNNLKTNAVGGSFVDGYYKVGPVAADFIKDKSLLRGYIREFHIKPMVRVIEWFK